MNRDAHILNEARETWDMFAGVEKHWGNLMPLMACEEMEELIQAISKAERHAKSIFEYDDVDNLIVEMGDVIISIGALMYRYDISPDNIMCYIGKKLGEKK